MLHMLTNNVEYVQHTKTGTRARFLFPSVREFSVSPRRMA